MSQPAEAAAPDPERHELRRLLIKAALAVAAIVALVLWASARFRPELEGVGRSFVREFGLAGMFVGTFMADAFHVPIPPQFYLFTAVTGRSRQAPAVLLILLASMTAGITGYYVGRSLRRLRMAQRWFRRTHVRLTALFLRYHYWALLVASVSPIPFSTLCYTAGFYRMPHRFFLPFVLLRVPRLMFFYTLFTLGWG